MGRVVIGHLVLITACAVNLSSGAEPTSQPHSPTTVLAREVRDKGWIAYGARSPKGDWDLFLCRPDGSDARNITGTPEFGEGAPRFSPDGRKMLYRRTPQGTKISHDQWGFQGELVIAGADGTGPVTLGKDGEFPWASWSPDGKQIACMTKKGIQIVDLDTKKLVREMPRRGMYQQLFWSPDGKWFCGVSNNLGEQWTVARMNAATGEVNPVNTFQNCTPDWFADSKRLIFSHRPKGQEGYGWTQL
jgi:Tol biopolymer transport system component